MTSEEQILRIPLKDSNDDFVLVNVASDGLAPLDLRLLATEGESPYFLRGGCALRNACCFGRLSLMKRS